MTSSTAPLSVTKMAAVCLTLGAVFLLQVVGQSEPIEIFNVFGLCTIVPSDCPNDNITFYLYTRSLGSQPYALYPENRTNLENAPLVENGPLVVLIHGYTGYRDYSPNMELRPAFLQAGDFNVISVDYGPLARSPCYVQASMNVRTVGKCIARALEQLFAARPGTASPANTHVIGFSLGAHVAGAVGTYTKLPWITGLDPALPLFDDYTSSASSRLDSSDAQFVDVIHTNAGIKGKVLPVGHVDFYCNSGTYQPGCNGNSSCDHVRAVEFYAESLNTSLGFYGAPCSLYRFPFLFGFGDVCYADFMNTPKDRLELMGLYVRHEARGTYQVLTNNKPPYARGPSQETARYLTSI